MLSGPSGDRPGFREASVRRRKSVGKYKTSSGSGSPSKSGRSQAKSSPSGKQQGHDSGSTIPEESDDCGINLRARSSELATLERLQDALRPLEDQQRDANDRLARLQRNFDVLMYQQKERDSASNINRDMVLLVVLVVMIQALLNWYLTHKAQQQQQHFGGGGN